MLSKNKVYKMSDKLMSGSQKDEVASKKSERIDRGRLIMEKMKKEGKSPEEIKADILEKFTGSREFVPPSKRESAAEKKKDAQKWADMKMDERKLRAKRKILESMSRGK